MITFAFVRVLSDVLQSLKVRAGYLLRIASSANTLYVQRVIAVPINRSIIMMKHR